MSRLPGLILIMLFLYSCGNDTTIRRDAKKILLIHSADQSPPAIVEGILQANMEVDTTGKESGLAEEYLKTISTIILHSTNLDSLTIRQRSAIERYVQAGGGLLALDCQMSSPYYWHWYTRFSTETGPDKEAVAVTKVSDSPDKLPFGIRLFDGGRMGVGRTTSGEVDWASVLNYLVGDNTWKSAGIHAEPAPDWNRFTKIVLDDQDIDEPMELAVLPDGRVIFIERKGRMKIYEPEAGKSRLLAEFDVCTEGNYEDGLLGITIDPDFENNGYIYVYYAPPCEIEEQYLSQFYLRGDSLIMASEKVLLKVGVQRETCCHTGGSLTFGPDGNLYLSTGDNTSSKESDGYTPIDERPGRGPFDAQKSSGNMNDLRGKVLRIKPNNYGTYDIPDGNLFPKDGSEGRPEIYAMGARNPFRISVDPKTGYLYWGDVGPDVGRDGRYGPESYDEWNQARTPGNYGWPFFVGDNKAYPDRDFATDQVGELFDPARPVNNSPNNTGGEILPPARPAFIWYPKGTSPEFPMLGQGSNSAMAGPVYDADRFPENSRVKLPAYYNGKLFIYEWARSWVQVVSMNEEGDITQIEPFLPNEEFVKPIEMELGPDGSIYMLEYGQNYFLNNPEAKLVKIEYAGGNRLPVPRIALDHTAGAAPLEVNFSAKGSFDYDENDSLNFVWDFDGKTLKGREASHTFTQPGIYEVKLVATDQAGESAEAVRTVQVGNAPPEISISLQGNQSFYLGQENIAYAVRITDLEDESGSGLVQENIKIRLDYIPDGNDLEVVLGGNGSIAGSMAYLAGEKLIRSSDCKSCHDLRKHSVGPSYIEVAERYDPTQENIEFLAGKIISGGNGNWGEKIMAGHPQHTMEETREMAKYILSVNQEAGSLPVEGTLTLNRHSSDEKGAYLLSATYTDQGANGISSLNTRKMLALKAPYLEAEDNDRYEKMGFGVAGANRNIPVARFIGEGAFMEFDAVDLTGVSALSFRVAPAAGGTIVVRRGGAQGETIGRLKINGSGQPDSWMEKTMTIIPKAGKETLYIGFEEPGNGRNLMQLDWIRLEGNHSL